MNMVHTFARAESRREFLKFFREQSQQRDVIVDLPEGEVVGFLTAFILMRLLQLLLLYTAFNIDTGVCKQH